MPAAPVRRIAMPSGRVAVTRRADGNDRAPFARRARVLPRQAHRALRGLGGPCPRPRLHRRARRSRRVADADLRRRLRAVPRDRRSAPRARPLARPAGGDPIGQRHRARAPRAGRDARRRAVLPGLVGVLARVERSREAPSRVRVAHAGPRLRRGRREVRERDQGGGAPRCGSRDGEGAGARARDDPLRRARGLAAHRRRRPRVRRRGAGHDREIPAHLGFDRQSEGGRADAADAVREPADDRAGAALSPPGAAGHRRLAAVESHLRQQPQFRAGDLERRLAVHRRREAGRGPVREERPQPARDRADGLLQRPARVRGAGAVSAARAGAPREVLQPPRHALLCRRRTVAAGLGRDGRARRADLRRAHPVGHRAWGRPRPARRPRSRPATACARG